MELIAQQFYKKLKVSLYRCWSPSGLKWAEVDESSTLWCHELSNESLMQALKTRMDHRDRLSNAGEQDVGPLEVSFNPAKWRCIRRSNFRSEERTAAPRGETTSSVGSDRSWNERGCSRSLRTRSIPLKIVDQVANKQPACKSIHKSLRPRIEMATNTNQSSDEN